MMNRKIFTKHFIIFISILLVFVSCNSVINTKKNGVEGLGLHGKVKSLKTIQYEVIEKFGEISKGDISSNNNSYYVFDFDKEGNLTDWDINDSKGFLDSKTLTKKNKEGIEVEMIGYNSDGSLDYKYTFSLDDKGSIVESNIFISDGSLDYKSSDKYQLDENNNWIKRIEYNNEIPKYITERTIEYY